MSRSKNIEENRIILDRIADALEAANAAPGAGAFSITYVFPVKDFGDGWTEDIQGPAGFRGTVRCVSVYDCTEALTVVTTEGRVDVGIQGGDADAYSVGEDLGALAIAAAITKVGTAGVVGTIPAAEDILVTGVAPTGGTPAGIATVALTVDYFV